MHIRFGLDLGTNSLGWAVYKVADHVRNKTLTPVELLDLGVRIFPDGRDEKSKPLAANRRDKRSARRQQDRYVQRRKKLINNLVACGLMPEDRVERKALEKIDPYSLRKRALEDMLEPHEFGRAIFHLSQRRGFKSNRKTDAKDNESTNMLNAIKKFEKTLKDHGARTIGEYLADRHELRQPVKFRGNPGAGGKLNWDFFPARAMLEKEFCELWKAQQHYYPEVLTDEVRATLHEIIFHQRPLKPVLPGKCTFNSSEDRAPRALPSVQRFRILQDLNHLRVREASGEEKRALSQKERDKLLRKLEQGKNISFNGVRRALKLPDTTVFSITSGDPRREEILGDKTASLFSKKQKNKAESTESTAAEHYGIVWTDLSRIRQDEIVMKLTGNQDDDEVSIWLENELSVTPLQARNLIHANLETGFARLGSTALNDIIPFMEKEVITYSEAAQKAGYNHSEPYEETGEVFERLPRYQEIEAVSAQLAGTNDPSDPIEKRAGRFPNPTVHVGLNQLRKVINALIRKHGVPSEIVLELARDLKNGEKKRKEIIKAQAQNQKKNEQRKQKLAEQGEIDNGDNRMRLRLWEELNPENCLDRSCPFSGKKICISMLFNGQAEIEHILPYSRTLDNSASNRTIAIREANRKKGDLSPAEAIDSNIFRQEDIERGIANFPENKKWRFEPDAMERFENEERGFLDRQLHETAWLSKLARIYLAKLSGKNNVYVVTGQQTSLLRAKWGLNKLLDTPNNKKNRNDHRHHAVDAAVIGVIDRGLLQKIATTNSRKGSEATKRLIIPEPYLGFRDQVSNLVRNIIVSHKPDHGKGGALHEETAYGVVINNPDGNIVFRKPVVELTKKEICRIRDPLIREQLIEKTKNVPKKSLFDVLATWSQSHDSKIRRLRVLKVIEDKYLIRPSNASYKTYILGENYCVYVIARSDGTWDFEGATRFKVNQPDWQPPNDYVMALHKGDMVELDDVNSDSRVIMKVQQIKMSTHLLCLVPHNEGGQFDKRHKDEDDPFRWEFVSFSKFQTRNLRRVSVDPAGIVKYV